MIFAFIALVFVFLVTPEQLYALVLVSGGSAKSPDISDDDDDDDDD